jgi:hypothetical protein
MLWLFGLTFTFRFKNARIGNYLYTVALQVQERQYLGFSPSFNFLENLQGTESITEMIEL